MKRQKTVRSLVVILLLLNCVAAVPAAILEVTCKGQVSTVNAGKGTLTIKNPELYSCEYPATGGPVCGWKPVSGTSSLTGTVPDPESFSVFAGGEPVVATSLGGPGGQWITLAKIFGTKETEQVITDIIGDPGTVPLPLVGDYTIDTMTVPDCNACTGTTCTAMQAKVAVKSSGNSVSEGTLAPGESLTYNGRNDGSSVTVKFVSGTAGSRSCPGMAEMTGTQPVSVFIVKVTPPAGFGQWSVRTATTTRPDEALTTLPASTALPVSSPTKSAGLLPAAAIGSLLVSFVVLMRRH